MTQFQKETQEYNQKEEIRTQILRNRLWAIASLVVCNSPAELKEFEERLDNGPETSTGDTAMIHISRQVRKIFPKIDVIHDKIEEEAAKHLDEAREKQNSEATSQKTEVEAA